MGLRSDKGSRPNPGRNNMNIPKPQEVYRHFKGNMYRVLAVAKHSETGEKLVVYQSLNDENDAYARPLEMFMSPVDKEKYPDAKQEMRFELTSEADQDDADLDAFMACETYGEKLTALVNMRNRLTPEKLTLLACTCDIVLPQGDTITKYEGLKSSLALRSKYEGTRLRN
ncbi:MAG: DUF1653 domain-containing protein [Lachnospiraceae bacterium]|nr:DUF1653 domain-containing protein [Lachnospiraceae bacterium]